MTYYISPSSGFGPCDWIVSTVPGEGTHTTLAGALAQAVSGESILLRTDVTEDVALKDGVDIVALSQSIIVKGKISFASSGTINLNGFTLQTNGDYCLEITGSAVSNVNAYNCVLMLSDNTGIHFTSSNASSSITIDNCLSLVQTTGICTFVSSSAGVLTFQTFTEGAGGGAAVNTISAGTLQMTDSDFGTPIAVTGTASFNARQFFSTVGDAAPLTLSDTSVCNINLSSINSGSGHPSVQVNAGSTLNISNATLSSSNAYAIAGSGNLSYGGIEFTGTTSSFDPALTLTLFQSTPSNAPSGYVFTSNGVNLSPSWQVASAGYAVVSFSTTSKTLALSDSYTFQNCSNAATQTITFPPNASVAFPIGARIDGAQIGVGQVVLAAGVGVTLHSKLGNLKTSVQYSGWSCIKIGTDEWEIVGDLAP